MPETIAHKLHFVDDDIRDNMHALYDDSEERMVRLLADRYNLPYIDLRGVAGEPDALKLIPENMAGDALVAPFKIVGKTMHIAVRDPENTKMRNLIEHINGTLGEPIIYIASTASLRHIWGRYADLTLHSQNDTGSINLSKAHSDEMFSGIKSIADFQNKIEDVIQNERANKISKIIELMIDGAIYFGASDIHTEPESSNVRIRYRIDGLLTDIFYIDEDIYRLVQSRLKLLSGLKISTHSKAQDGRFTVERVMADPRVLGLAPRSNRRGITPKALLVCKVESTRCPVWAACIATSAVSLSLISPIIIMSGSWRNAARRPSTNPYSLLTLVWDTPSI